MLFYYAKANQMRGHKFNDDVAIVFAKNKNDAFYKFSRYYKNANIDDVRRIYKVALKDGDPIILTDY